LIKPEMIPDEVVEAAAFAEYEAWRDRCDLRNDTLEWRGIEEEHREEHRENVRVTIAAALNAWPDAGMSQYHEEALVLPLPTEARDE
jgi:hypothetical protein